MSNTITEIISQTEDRFKSICPQYMDYQKEAGFAVQLLSNSEYLRNVAQANPSSLQKAITNIAAIGLSLNPAEKLAYLIPRNVKIGDNKWQKKIFLEPSYMGLCKLATDSGSIEWIQARCVYANDTFIDNGVGEKPTHAYNAFSTDRGDFVGAYCIAKTSSGDFLTTTMDAKKIYDIRGRSESWKKYPNTGVWHTDFEEQAKKTVVRNASKLWPKTNIHLVNAVALSNENMGFEPIQTQPELKDFSVDQKEYFDQMIEKSDKIGMYVFSKTIDENTFINLYHSFTKGTKGKYQKIVDSLVKEGGAMFIDCVAAIESAFATDDAGAMLEIINDESAEFVEMILSKLNPEVVSWIKENKE